MLGRGFEATADIARLAEADAILICVPTPLSRNREPDLGYIVSTARGAAAASARRAARRAGIDHLSRHHRRSAEADPRSRRPRLRGDAVPRLFAGARGSRQSDFSTRRASPRWSAATVRGRRKRRAALYRQFVERVVPVSSAETAEAVKLTENIFRAVNIALVNELKVVYDAMGIDIWEVIDGGEHQALRLHAVLSGSRPRRPLHPHRSLLSHLEGARVRGADALHRAGRRDQHGDAARRRRSRSPRRSTGAVGKGLNGARVLVVGLAYKKNVDDMRESPALRIMELLEAAAPSPTTTTPSSRRSAPAPAAALAGRRSVPIDAANVRRLRRGAHRHRPRRHRLGGAGRRGAARRRHPQRHESRHRATATASSRHKGPWRDEPSNLPLEGMSKFAKRSGEDFGRGACSVDAFPLPRFPAPDGLEISTSPPGGGYVPARRLGSGTKASSASPTTKNAMMVAMPARWLPAAAVTVATSVGPTKAVALPESA